MTLQVPTRHNTKLTTLVERVNVDAELVQMWKCANINAVNRSGINDHGEVHIRIVANAGLRLLRLLAEAGIQPNIVLDHGLTQDDAEVIVVLGACLHDLGIAVHRDEHEQHSVSLAYPKIRQLLAGIYDEPAITMLTADTLHAIIAHRWDVRCLTLEAGVLKVADALDMTEGRSRIPFEAGSINIHSVSAQAVTAVNIAKGVERPVRITIVLANPAGIYQVDELLKRKLRNSTLAPYVEVEARLAEEGAEDKVFEVFRM
ncbi:MAG: HD domain-containing protein [Chloroflexi bacterium]|nr:HD domain-containing protein [Chloroflexota bacterium]